MSRDRKSDVTVSVAQFTETARSFTSSASKENNGKSMKTKMEPPRLNKEQLIRLPDSRKHSLVFDWLTKVADFLRQSNTTQIRSKQDVLVGELEILLACNAAPPVRLVFMI